MREDERERRPRAPATPPVWLPGARCQVCGAPHEAADSILCAACGEPVLLCGWA